MDRYKITFLFVSIMASVPSTFLFWVGMKNLSLSHLFFWGGMLMLWWCTYIYLRMDKKFSFWWSFLLINLFWWPLLAQTIRRILFVIENGGMDRADGYGSPMAFLLGLVGEQFFFIPLSIAITAGILTIRGSTKTLPPNADSGS